MKKKVLLIMLCGSLFSHVLMSQNKSVDSRFVTPENVAVAPRVDAMTTDGLLNEAGWVIDKPVSKVVSGTPGIDLNEAYFGVAYNAEYLYIGLDVNDSILTPYEMGEVFIDGNNNGGAYGESDLHLRFAGPYISVVYPDSITGVLLGFAIKPLGNGYTAELGIPWSELGITPVAGGQIGFDLILSDGDSGTGVDYMMAWNGGIENYTGTSSFGDLMFQPENEVTAPKSDYITVNGLLDESDWKIDQIVNIVALGTPGDDPNTSYFGAAYNANFLYVGLDVIDTILTAYEMGEVFIDGNNNGGVYDESDLHLRFAGPYIQVIYPDTIYGVLLGFAVKPTGFGYTAELGIPWSELGITPVEGEQIGFDLILSDGDSGTGVDYMMAWNGGLQNYAGTSSFGDLIFGISSNINDNVDYSDQIVLFPNPSTGIVSLGVNSDSFEGILTMHVADIAGRTVINEQYEVSSGKMIELNASLFTSGVYFVTIQGKDGAKAVKKLIIQ